MRDDKKYPTVLTRRDDPAGKAAAVAHKWVIVDKIQFATQTDGGKLKGATHFAIRSGDFVDVTVVPEIATYKSNAGRKVQINLHIKRVILLCPSSKVKRVCRIYVEV